MMWKHRLISSATSFFVVGVGSFLLYAWSICNCLYAYIYLNVPYSLLGLGLQGGLLPSLLFALAGLLLAFRYPLGAFLVAVGAIWHGGAILIYVCVFPRELSGGNVLLILFFCITFLFSVSVYKSERHKIGNKQGEASGQAGKL